MRLDIGSGLFQRSVSTGYNWSPQLPLKILLFGSSKEKEDFDSLVGSASWSGFISQIAATRVYLLVTHPWLFSAQGAPSFNFGNSFVSHVQRLDDNPTAFELSGNLSGRILTPNFCVTINRLSNQFLVTFERLRYSRSWHFLSFFHSFVHLQIPKSCPRTISHTCKSS